MKKIIKILLVVLLLLIPFALFAQTIDPGTGFDIMSLFTSFTGFGAGILIITGIIARYILKNLSTLGRSITSWVVALIIGFAGYFFQLGIFVGIEWWNVLVIIISFAIGSNVIYNIEWLRNLLAFLKIVPKKSIK